MKERTIAVTGKIKIQNEQQLHQMHKTGSKVVETLINTVINKKQDYNSQRDVQASHTVDMRKSSKQMFPPINKIKASKVID